MEVFMQKLVPLAFIYYECSGTFIHSGHKSELREQPWYDRHGKTQIQTVKKVSAPAKIEIRIFNFGRNKTLNLKSRLEKQEQEARSTSINMPVFSCTLTIF